jgi:hypothetical protein
MPAITVDDVIDALVLYLAPIVPGVVVARGSANLVPLPPSPCIIVRDITRQQLATATTEYDAPNESVTFTAPMRQDLQIDCYGPTSADMSHAIQTTFKTWYATEHFPDFIKPLWCDDAMRVPLVTGEQQYEDRWMMTLHIQYNGGVTLDQEFFDVVGETGCIPADVFY